MERTLLCIQMLAPERERDPRFGLVPRARQDDPLVHLPDSWFHLDVPAGALLDCSSDPVVSAQSTGAHTTRRPLVTPTPSAVAVSLQSPLVCPSQGGCSITKSIFSLVAALSQHREQDLHSTTKHSVVE